MSDEVNMKRCICCARPAELVCARCSDNYCSVECQRADWQVHRQICFRMPNLVPDMEVLNKKLNASLNLTQSAPNARLVTSPSTLYASLEDLQEISKSDQTFDQTHQEQPIVASEVQPNKPKVVSSPAKEVEEPKQAPVLPETKAVVEPQKVLDAKKSATAETKEIHPVEENAKTERKPLKIPYSSQDNQIKLVKLHEPEVKVPKKPIMFMDLKFRVWPDTKNVKVKILYKIEQNVFVLREDYEHVDGYFDFINEEVNKYARKSHAKIANYQPIKGEMVLALYEGEWYRAHVMDPNPEGIIVLYIDHGKMSIVTQSELVPAAEHLKFDVYTRDFVIDNMPEELDEKQKEIIASEVITITNIHRVNGVEFHCNIFGF